MRAADPAAIEEEPAQPAGRFATQRANDIRRARPWHRYAHHIRVLPARLRELAAELRVSPGGRVLDYGSAEAPYRHFFGSDVSWVAADLPGNPDADLELRPDGTVPAPDGSFDAVLSTQVLEHVADPALHLAESRRVLRTGGRMLLSTHGVFIYHPDPDDYWRWTGAGLQKAVRDAGFEIVRFEGIIGLLPTGLQLVQDAVYWQLPRALQPVLALVVQTLAALADRLHSSESRAMNAQVFALVAEKP
jgi:SAM-dependent methyltransferase